MDVPIGENRLQYSSSMSIYFLDTIEATLSHSPRECRDLLYTDDTRVGDDEEIELIVDPVEENKGEKCYPKYTKQCPIK
jgi:hypothetical protein